MKSFKQVIHCAKIKIIDFCNPIIQRKNQIIEWAELHPLKTIVILYLMFVVMKILLSQLVVNVTASYDDYLYSKMARSFWYEHVFKVNGEFSHQYPPLYPIAISPAYIFDDMMDISRAIRIINAFFSSLIIFPAFFLAKEFLDKKKSLFISTIVSGMAGSMSWIFYPYSENLYFPLLFFTLFLIYKSLLETGYKFKILSGIFVGLCFLTKYTTGALVPAVLFVFIIISFYRIEKSRIKQFVEAIKNWAILSSIAGIVIAPWFIRNGLHFGFTVPGMVGYSGWVTSATTKFIQIAELNGGLEGIKSSENLLYNLLIQITTHNGFLILGTGIVFFGFFIVFLYIALKKREAKLLEIGCLLILVLEFYVLLTAWHGIKNAGYLNGRYCEPLLPIIVIIGYAAIVKKNYIPRLSLLFVSFLLPLFSLITIDLSTTAIMRNLSISHFIGLIKSRDYFSALKLQPIISSTLLLKYISICSFFIVTIIIIFFIKKNEFKKLIALGITLMISSSIIACSELIIIQDYGSKSDIAEIGKWFNNEISGKEIYVIFDKNSFSTLGGTIAQRSIGSWINAPIKIREIEENISNQKSIYVLSSQIFNFTLINEFKISKPLNSIRIDENWNMTIFIYYLNSNN